MLNVMRENLRHLKWVLVIVAVSMVAYLGAFFFDPDSTDGTGTAWAARVNGTTITADELFRAARQIEETYRNALGPQYDQIRQQLQLGTQAVQRLVTEEIMLQEARRLGLRATKEEVAAAIYRDPSFADGTGRFVGTERYLGAIRRVWPGGSESYEAWLGDQIAIDKWKQLLTEPVTVTDAELERIERDRRDNVSFDYILFGLGEQKHSSSVSESEMASWYESHQDLYRRGEGRRIRYVLVDRGSLAAKVDVPDAEIESHYRANEPAFVRPDQRRARHILFRLPAGASATDKRSIHDLAESVRKRVESGEDFASLARAMSQDPASAGQGGDLGYFGRDQLTPALEKAVFEAPVGTVAPVVESEFGFHILQVTDSRPAGTTPLSEVKEQIRRQLQFQKAHQVVQTEAQRLRARIQQPQDLDAVAASEQLRVEETIVTRDEALPELGPSPELAEALFRLAPGEVSAPLGVASGLVIAALVETTPSAVRPLSEVRARVQSDVLSERARQAALAAARRALAQSGDLAQIAKSLGKTVQNAKEFTRGGVVQGLGNPGDLADALFAPGVGTGSRGAAPVPAGAVLYTVIAREAFDPVRFADTRETLRSEVTERRQVELLQSVLENLRSSSYQVEINEPLVRQANG